MKTINLTIDTDATIEYDVKGIKGKSCKEVTKFIDELAGNKILDTHNTGEYCQVETKERIQVKK